MQTLHLLLSIIPPNFRHWSYEFEYPLVSENYYYYYYSSMGHGEDLG